MILIGSNFLRVLFRSKVETGFLDLGALNLGQLTLAPLTLASLTSKSAPRSLPLNVGPSTLAPRPQFGQSQSTQWAPQPHST